MTLKANERTRNELITYLIFAAELNLRIFKIFMDLFKIFVHTRDILCFVFNLMRFLILFYSINVIKC